MTDQHNITPAEDSDFTIGLAYLKSQVITLPDQPGVYRMFDAKGNHLYVGKARHLDRGGNQLHPAKPAIKQIDRDGLPNETS